MLTVLSASCTYDGTPFKTLQAQAGKTRGIYVNDFGYAHSDDQLMRQAAIGLGVGLATAAIAGPLIAPYLTAKYIGSWGITHAVGAKITWLRLLVSLQDRDTHRPGKRTVEHSSPFHQESLMLQTEL